MTVLPRAVALHPLNSHTSGMLAAWCAGNVRLSEREAYELHRALADCPGSTRQVALLIAPRVVGADLQELNRRRTS